MAWGGASSTGDLSGISLASPYKSLKRHVVDGLPSEGLRIYDLAVNLGLASHPEVHAAGGARGLDRIREVLVEIATAELVAVQHEEAARLHKAPQAYEATSSSGADDIAASYRYPPPRRRASRGLPWRPSAAVVDRAVLLAARAGRRDLVTALVPGLAALVDLSPEAFEAVVDLSVNDAVAVGCSECMRTAGADVGNVAVHRERWGARGALNALQALAARRGPAGVHWRAYAAVLRARVRAGSERPDSALRLCRMAIDAGMGVHPEVRRLATLFEHW
ncbi:hypothetical protein HK405_008255 [Cladochytrium tenue]|nr:hypothetical protein HK405_008255 [Cladochytrium tenue]